jgi:uncharacterized DUF497 family protein
VNFDWDDKKNEELKSEGRPSFEDAVLAISENGVLVDDKNPVHAGQRLYVVMINDYPHAVPYEIRGDVHWLITVYPTRKYKR